MNKIVNLFSLFFLIVYCFFAIGSIYDLAFSVYRVNSIPYLSQIVTGLTILVFLLGLVRIKRRREGKRDINRFSKFVFSTSLSKKQRNATLLFLSIEILFAAFFTTILVVIYPQDDHFFVLPLLIVVSLLGLENLIFLFQFKTKPKQFKIGVSEQLVAYFDREMHLYYYDGLQRMEIYQNMLNFKYKKDLNLFLNLELIPPAEMHAFLTNLKAVLDEKQVFFDDSFHQYLTNLSK